MAKKRAVVTGPHPGGGWQNKIEGNQRPRTSPLFIARRVARSAIRYPRG